MKSPFFQLFYPLNLKLSPSPPLLEGVSDVQCTAHQKAFQAIHALYGLDGQIKVKEVMKSNPVSHAHLNGMERGYHERHSLALSPTMRCVDKIPMAYG